jgi:NitT/TauT family transport system permease protein
MDSPEFALDNPVAAAPARATRTRPRRPGMWAIRGPLSRNQYWLFAAFGLLLPLALWWVASSGASVNKVFMPSPVDVFDRLLKWYTEDDLLSDIGISVYRVTAGFLFSAVFALPIALMIGTFRPVQAVLEPLTDFIRYMPAVAFIPLVMLWVGIEESSKIAIIFIGTFFQMVLMMAEDVRRVPQAQIEAAQTMGARKGETVNLVIFQSAKPALLDTLRVTMGWAWTYLVVAELVAANSGIGYSILKAQRYLQTDKIFVGIILIGLIGLVMDQLFRFLHRKAFPWLHLRS